MLQSRDNYIFTVNKTISDVKEQLLRNTLVKKRLIREITNKRFIGQIYNDGFSIIGSSAICVVCILKGRFNKIDEQITSIEIETKIHKAFLILFICFTIVISILTISSYILQQRISFSLMPFILVLISTVFFKLMLYLMYIRARDLSIRDIEKVLEI